MNFRLVDYLVLVTDSIGESLFLLAGLLGEERALRVIENGAELENVPPIAPELLAGFLGPKEADIPFDEDAPNPYTELQMKVDRLRHHPQIEFYVWSYPGYRVWAESGLTLDRVWLPRERDTIAELERDAIARFEQWYESLGIPEVIAAKTYEVLHRPWKKFQHELYKAAGHAPFRLVNSARPE